jgi:hypothetical protein
MNKRVCEVGATVLATGTMGFALLSGVALLLAGFVGVCAGVGYFITEVLGINPDTIQIVVLVVCVIILSVGITATGYEVAKENGLRAWFRRHCEDFWERGQLDEEE